MLKPMLRFRSPQIQKSSDPEVPESRCKRSGSSPPDLAPTAALKIPFQVIAHLCPIEIHPARLWSDSESYLIPLKSALLKSELADARWFRVAPLRSAPEKSVLFPIT
jgi:hypothetical protein